MMNNTKNRFGLIGTTVSGIISGMLVFSTFSIMSAVKMPGFQEQLQAQLSDLGMDITTYGISVQELVNAMQQVMIGMTIFMVVIFVCGLLGYLKNKPGMYKVSFIMSIIATVIMIFSGVFLLIALMGVLSLTFYYAQKVSRIKVDPSAGYYTDPNAYQQQEQPFMGGFENPSAPQNNQQPTVIDIDAQVSDVNSTTNQQPNPSLNQEVEPKVETTSQNVESSDSVQDDLRSRANQIMQEQNQTNMDDNLDNETNNNDINKG